jgi:phosphatidylserine/phosphatidylglycerophosphate/cardiolipin synthase-like enzyme
MSATRLGVTLVWVLAVSTAVGLFTLSSADDKREVAPTTAAATAPAATPAGQVRARATQDGVSAYFSPHGGCTEAVVEQIAQARKTLRVQAYYLTSAPIAKAIADARGRGVDVTVLLDKSQQTAKYSSATFLLNAGVATYIDHRHAIAHNKIILIDGHVIVTGSFNFTKAAEESNAENLLVIRDKPDLYAAYEQNFQEHLKHSEKYAGQVQKTPALSRLP